MFRSCLRHEYNNAICLNDLPAQSPSSAIRQTAVDALFLCFSDDYNQYDLTSGRDLVASADLYNFMVKHEDIDARETTKPRPDHRPETIRFRMTSV